MVVVVVEVVVAEVVVEVEVEVVVLVVVVVAAADPTAGLAFWNAVWYSPKPWPPICASDLSTSAHEPYLQRRPEACRHVAHGARLDRVTYAYPSPLITSCGCSFRTRPMMEPQSASESFVCIMQS